MAVGDVFSGFSSQLSTGQRFTALPAAAGQAVIHNLYGERDFTVEVYDGTNVIAHSTYAGPIWIQALQVHCTTAYYLRILNSSTGAQYVAFDGIVTK